MNVGFSHEVTFAYCCNTDNCNSATLPPLGPQSNNNLQCFSCDSLVDTECTTPLQCKGVEDRCIQVTHTYETHSDSSFGCVSRSFCAAYADLANPKMQNKPPIATEVSCCETSFCNSVTTTTASSGIIHLLLGLLVFTFY